MIHFLSFSWSLRFFVVKETKWNYHNKRASMPPLCYVTLTFLSQILIRTAVLHCRMQTSAVSIPSWIIWSLPIVVWRTSTAQVFPTLCSAQIGVIGLRHNFFLLETVGTLKISLELLGIRKCKVSCHFNWFKTWHRYQPLLGAISNSNLKCQ